MNKTKPSPQKKWIWIAHPTKTFTTAYIISEDTTTLTVETQENKILTINKELTYKMNPPKFDNIDDLASLSYLNEPSVLHNLATRYYNDIIYTYSGLFLVAINPYKKLKIYSSDTIREYHINKPQDLPPHIYATASQALRNMLYNRENQSILITGESGAGKTENTKKVIQFLTTIAPVIEKGQSEGIEGVDIRDINNTRDTIDTNDTIDNTINTIDTRDTRDNINYLQSSFQHTIEHQIFMAHPILESFGNAQTIKNNNSSRFGKFIKILFSNSTITGAYIEKYLLEKSRVTHQNPNERNYHIFYQLLCGADQSLKDKLLLEGDHTNYTYTRGSSERDSSESKRDSRRDNSSSESKRDSRSSESKRDSDSRSSESKRDSRRDNSSNRRDNSSNTRDNNTHNNTHNNTPHINNINDSNDFITLNKCFDVLKITEEERLNYFTVISAILHLGNIEVLQHNDQAYINNTETVEKVCNLLKIETKKFLSTLLHPISMAGTEKVINMRNKNQVINIIEALSRTLYERLFDTVIDRLNYTLNSKLDSNKFIGVLDIAGFEIFKNNSFEQLCINYTNEKLQQFFNHHMFVLEQELYKQENIKWDYIDFGLDLQPTIDVIDKSSPIGVMSYLDEECVIPKGSDKTFLEKVISGIKCSGGDSSRMGDSSSRGDRDSNYRGVNNLSDKQQGVNTSSKKQQGVNTSSKKQQGVNNLSDTLHPVNNNHIEQHPLNTIKHPSFNQYGNIFGPLRLKNGFFIKHYAGKVEYLVDGWIEKNKDTYFDSLSTLLLTSTNLFIKDLFDCYISSTKKGFFRTVSQRHKEEIYSLMTQLTNTSPHFVRCILPNIYKKNYNFDLSVVLQQLRCNGVIEGIRISRLGYPGRMTFIEFKKRYSVLIRKRSKIVNSDKVEGDMDLVEGDMDIVEGDSNSRGIVEGDSNIKGDSDTSNKQQGVNNSTNKQQGVNNSTNKQQGVNHTTNNLHTLTNKQHPLTNTTTNNTTNHLTLKDSVFLILSTLNIPTNSYRIGITKVFFKQGVLGDLEDIRDNIIISLSKEIISLYLKVLIIRKNNKKKKNEKNIKILQKNLKILLNIKRWKWFKLYIKIKPLFVVTHYELESKKLKDIIYNLNIENNNYKSYNDKLNCNICKIEKELESSNKLVEEWKDKLLYLRGEYESRIVLLESREKEYESREKEYEDRIVGYESRIVLLESREKEYEDRIVLLENREKEYESRIGEYENSNRLLESRIEDHTNTIKEKDTLIQEKDTLIQEKDILIQEKDILIQDLNNNIEDHIKIIKDKDNNIKDKDTIIKDRDTMINTLNTNIQDYTTSVNNLQLLLNDKTSELNTIKEKHNLTLKELKDKEMGNRIVEYESKIVGLESRIVEYENKIVGLENSNKEYEDKNKVLEDKNKVLEDSNKVLEDKIEELSNTNISLSNTNTTLSNKNKELENKNKELENTNLSLENTNTSLSNTNISLSTQVTDLSNTNLSLSNTNISLSTQVTDLSNTNLSLSNTNISLSTQVTDLSNTNLSLSNTNISLSNQVTDLTNQVTSLSEVNKELKNNYNFICDLKGEEVEEVKEENKVLNKRCNDMKNKVIELEEDNKRYKDIECSNRGVISVLECKVDCLERRCLVLSSRYGSGNRLDNESNTNLYNNTDNNLYNNNLYNNTNNNLYNNTLYTSVLGSVDRCLRVVEKWVGRCVRGYEEVYRRVLNEYRERVGVLEKEINIMKIKVEGVNKENSRLRVLISSMNLSSVLRGVSDVYKCYIELEVLISRYVKGVLSIEGECKVLGKEVCDKRGVIIELESVINKMERGVSDMVSMEDSVEDSIGMLSVLEGGDKSRGMLGGVNDNYMLGGVNDKSSVLEGLSTNTDTYHPFSNNTDTYHPVNNQSNEQHPLNISSNDYNPHSTSNTDIPNNNISDISNNNIRDNNNNIRDNNDISNLLYNHQPSSNTNTNTNTNTNNIFVLLGIERENTKILEMKNRRLSEYCMRVVKENEKYKNININILIREVLISRNIIRGKSITIKNMKNDIEVLRRENIRNKEYISEIERDMCIKDGYKSREGDYKMLYFKMCGDLRVMREEREYMKGRVFCMEEDIYRMRMCVVEGEGRVKGLVREISEEKEYNEFLRKIAISE